MREWMDELAKYMESKEEISFPLDELSEEMHQTVLETDVLLEASDQLQSAYSSICGKMEHAKS